MSTLPRHGLNTVISQAGFQISNPFQLHPNAPLEEAWRIAAECCGISETELARHIAAHFRLSTANLAAIEQPALKLVPEKIARQFQVLALRARDNQIIVATSDPMNLAAEQALGFVSGRRVVFGIATPSQLWPMIAPERPKLSLCKRPIKHRSCGSPIWFRSRKVGVFGVGRIATNWS